MAPPLVKYVKGRSLLVIDPEDQLLFQQAGGMTDRQMIALNQTLIGLAECFAFYQCLMLYNAKCIS